MVVHLSIDYRRQKFVASYVLPARLGRDLRPRCSSGASLAPAKTRYVSGSVCTCSLPRSSRCRRRRCRCSGASSTSSSEFEHFSAHAYGHLANRKPDKRKLKRRPDFTNADGLALTFAMACVDQGLDMPHPSRLPMLFDVDGALGIDGGQRWALNCGAVNCRELEGSRCAYHELGPVLPTNLPKEVRFGVPAPFPLDGSSHRLFGPLY